MAENLLSGIAGDVLKDPEAKTLVESFLGLDSFKADIAEIKKLILQQNTALNAILTALRVKK